MSGPTNYQWVITSTNYDGTAAPKSLRFDGIDDYLNLPYMGLYANGSASVVGAATLYHPSAESSILSERNTTTANPAYRLAFKLSNGNLGTQIRLDDGVTFLNAAESIATAVASNTTKVFSVIDTGSTVSPYVSGAIGTIKNYARVGSITANNTVVGATIATTSSAFMFGNIHGLILTKSALSDTDRRRCEQFLASRLSTLGVTLS